MKTWTKLTVAIGVAAGIASVISACAKDQNQDQYRAGLAQQNLAQYQAVAGVYPGRATSKVDQKDVGAATLTLKALLVSQKSSDGTSQEEAATMTGSLSLTGLTNSSVEFSGGNYDADSRLFTANFMIPDYSIPNPGSATKQVNIQGTIAGGTFTGSVFIDGQDSDGIDIKATVNGVASSATYDQTGARARELSLFSQKFASGAMTGSNNHGTPSCPAGVTPPTPTDTWSMTFFSPNAVPEQEFFYLISPDQNLTVTVNDDYTGLSPECKLVPGRNSNTFTNVTVSQDGSTIALSANATATFSKGLNCTGVTQGSQVTWNCTIKSATGNKTFPLQTLPPTAN